MRATVRPRGSSRTRIVPSKKRASATVSAGNSARRRRLSLGCDVKKNFGLSARREIARNAVGSAHRRLIEAIQPAAQRDVGHGQRAWKRAPLLEIFGQVFVIDVNLDAPSAAPK